MKTIEERAEEYVKDGGGIGIHPDDHYFIEEAYTKGAKSERALLTEWHSPDELPDTDRYVLIKINNTPEYAVGYYNGNDDSWHSPAFYEIKEGFIGWREIHE